MVVLLFGANFIFSLYTRQLNQSNKQLLWIMVSHHEARYFRLFSFFTTGFLTSEKENSLQCNKVIKHMNYSEQSFTNGRLYKTWLTIVRCSFSFSFFSIRELRPVKVQASTNEEIVFHSTSVWLQESSEREEKNYQFKHKVHIASYGILFNGG